MYGFVLNSGSAWLVTISQNCQRTRKRTSFFVGFPLSAKMQSLWKPAQVDSTLHTWGMCFKNYMQKKMARTFSGSRTRWTTSRDRSTSCPASACHGIVQPIGHPNPSRIWNPQILRWCGNGLLQRSKGTTPCLKKWLMRNSAKPKKRVRGKSKPCGPDTGAMHRNVPNWKPCKSSQSGCGRLTKNVVEILWCRLKYMFGLYFGSLVVFPCLFSCHAQSKGSVAFKPVPQLRMGPVSRPKIR